MAKGGYIRRADQDPDQHADRKTRAAIHMAKLRDFVGGKPTASQQVQIKALVPLLLRLDELRWEIEDAPAGTPFPDGFLSLQKEARSGAWGLWVSTKGSKAGAKRDFCLEAALA